ncbi:flagellar biosynthesis anti-sigma factor FlgM [Pseudoxanthomonas broegbernensis]|uniref:Negative regulator of flagellin synthesis n=1 Tax=Pseudoxanthomonas broegbernensis TaxID=83619 RepID=A0A7V8GL99_9GAMM|nr:flagellar biosynthesis anti-sigma factor FlgM [Pseudoxanthomonas broegbernensis]KAF1685576.1 flagellar biosynthesis anti-sigma factor FlgM [Pseudoxanthomonas broegbernensis]MBB6065947.1 negative regulator of flagellin synthesis FlgM [Pseudoxanthomonas broegbernensis]
MSQKIEGVPPPAVRSTGPVGGHVAPAGADRSGPVEATQAGDSLRLTGEATGLQALQRELSAAPAVDSARVAEVRQAVESGSYRIDPARIADRMLEMDRLLG